MAYVLYFSALPSIRVACAPTAGPAASRDGSSYGIPHHCLQPHHDCALIAQPINSLAPAGTVSAPPANLQPKLPGQMGSPSVAITPAPLLSAMPTCRPLQLPQSAIIGEGIPLMAPRYRDVPLRLRSARKHAKGIVWLRDDVAAQLPENANRRESIATRLVGKIN